MPAEDERGENCVNTFKHAGMKAVYVGEEIVRFEDIGDVDDFFGPLVAHEEDSM